MQITMQIIKVAFVTINRFYCYYYYELLLMIKHGIPFTLIHNSLICFINKRSLLLNTCFIKNVYFILKVTQLIYSSTKYIFNINHFHE